MICENGAAIAHGAMVSGMTISVGTAHFMSLPIPVGERRTAIPHVGGRPHVHVTQALVSMEPKAGTEEFVMLRYNATTRTRYCNAGPRFLP